MFEICSLHEKGFTSFDDTKRLKKRNLEIKLTEQLKRGLLPGSNKVLSVQNDSRASAATNVLTMPKQQ